MDQQGQLRLQRQLQEAEVRFDAWKQGTAAAVSKERGAHQRLMQENKENIAAMNARLDQTQAAAGSRQKEKEEQETEIAGLRKEIADLQRLKTDFAAKARQSSADLTAVEGEVASCQTELAQEASSAEVQKQNALKRVKMYEQYLGLRFVNTGGKLRFVFSCVDPADHARQFAVTLTVDETTHSYQLEGTKPDLGDGVEAMVHLLNETQDLGAFIKSIRMRFKALC